MISPIVILLGMILTTSLDAVEDKWLHKSFSLNVPTPTESVKIKSSYGITRLLQGNQRYVHDALEHPDRTRARRESIISKQEPFATIVGCSDSRVSPEIIFDQGLGDLFIVRVAGNVIGPLELESIDYSVIYLHSSVILVLGHENCGAVKAVLEGTTHDIESIATRIQPAVEEVKNKKAPHLLEAAIKRNALRMRDYLIQTPAIQKLISSKLLEVHAGYYHLQSGVVELLHDETF